MAAAAHVIRATPVDELVAGLGGGEHVAGVRAAERGPDPAQGVGVGVAVHAAARG